MILVPCCAATYDSVRGAGRHLAGCHAEDPQELPQVVLTRILKKASRQLPDVVLLWCPARLLIRWEKAEGSGPKR